MVQLLLRALLKAEKAYLQYTLQLLLGTPLKAEFLLMICFKVYYMSVLYNKVFTKNEEN